MRLILVVCLPMLFLLGGCRSQKNQKAVLPAKPDPEAIQGTWMVLSFDVGGKASSNFANTEFSFTEVALTLKTVKEPAQEIKGTYRIDPDKNPKEIDLNLGTEGKEQKTLGIYSLEKGLLTLGIMKSETERPTAWSDPGVGVLTLKRIK